MRFLLVDDFFFTTNVYLGITLHCVDKNESLRRIFLGLKELHGSHTGYLLRNKAEELLNEYGVHIEDVYKIVTDSGSNILSAFKDVLQGLFIYLHASASLFIFFLF